MATVSVESTHVGKNFLFQWVLANALGLTLAMMSVAVIDRVGGDDGGLADGLAHIRCHPANT